MGKTFWVLFSIFLVGFVALFMQMLFSMNKIQVGDCIFPKPLLVLEPKLAETAKIQVTDKNKDFYTVCMSTALLGEEECQDLPKEVIDEEFDNEVIVKVNCPQW